MDTPRGQMERTRDGKACVSGVFEMLGCIGGRAGGEVSTGGRAFYGACISLVYYARRRKCIRQFTLNMPGSRFGE